ncbi:MAG: hypothetical protein GY711_02325 [bacterium]|nr:hypothetical protein [bacterium]
MKPILYAAALLSVALLCAAQQTPAKPDPEAGAEALVRKLYELVTFEAGTTPDWDEVRTLFVPEAVVVLRTGREEMSVFSVDGFVADFVKFIEDAKVEKTGFTERILGMKSFVYGDIAQVLVLFDSHIPGSGREPHQGIDSFELIRQKGAWRVVSIVNERPTKERPIPKELFE